METPNVLLVSTWRPSISENYKISNLGEGWEKGLSGGQSSLVRWSTLISHAMLLITEPLFLSGEFLLTLTLHRASFSLTNQLWHCQTSGILAYLTTHFVPRKCLILFLGATQCISRLWPVWPPRVATSETRGWSDHLINDLDWSRAVFCC